MQDTESSTPGDALYVLRCCNDHGLIVPLYVLFWVLADRVLALARSIYGEPVRARARMAVCMASGGDSGLGVGEGDCLLSQNIYLQNPHSRLASPSPRSI
jgi:hypothetical protein